jgi:hypothetical protein
MPAFGPVAAGILRIAEMRMFAIKKLVTKQSSLMAKDRPIPQAAATFEMGVV